MKGYDSAFRDFTSALELDPNFYEAYCNRGNAHFEAGRPDLAVSDYEQAIRLNPNDGDVHFNHGLVLLARGKRDRAREGFEKASKLGHEKAKGYLETANTGEKKLPVPSKGLL